MRHRLQFATLAVQAVLADVLQRAGVYHGVLTELHLDHVEAEGLRLPDQILQRAIRRTLGAGFGQGTLHDLQVGDEIVAAVVHEVGVALDGVAQAIGHHQHDGAVQLLGGDQCGLVGQALAHLLLVAPQALQLGAGRGRLGLHGQVAADRAGGLLKGADHMVAELAGDLTADLGGDVRVAVAVGADPASRMEERRALRLFETGLVAQQPVVETVVDLGNRGEQRVVEDVEDGIGLLDRRRLLQRDRGRAEQRVDLVVEAADVLLLVGAAEALVLFQQLRDAADLAFDCLAARFGRMRREHRVEFELLQQRLGFGRPHFGQQLMVGGGQFVHRVNGFVVFHLVLALVQHGNAVVLLTQVGEVEICGECAGEQLGVVQIHRIDGGDGLCQTILIGVRIRRRSGEMLGACLHRVVAHGVERRQQLRVIFAQYVAQNAQAQAHVVAERLRQLPLFGALGPGAGRHDGRVGGRDLLIGIGHS